MLKIVMLGLLLLGTTTITNAEVFTKELGKRKIQYKLDIEDPSNVEFSFKHKETMKGRTNYTFMVYDEKGSKNHGRQFVRIFPDTTTTDETKVNLPLKTGNYSIEMYVSSYYDRPFDFNIIKTLGNFEQEPNDSFNEATSIKNGISYTGYIQKKDGLKLHDLFKFHIDQDATVNLGFKVDDVCKEGVGYEGFDISLYDSQEKALIGRLANKEQETLKMVSLLSGDYFIKIELSKSDQKGRGLGIHPCKQNRAYHLSYMKNQ